MYFKNRDFETALRKIRDYETLKSAQKTRLRDPWNSTKILRDADFLKDQSPPLSIFFTLRQEEKKIVIFYIHGIYEFSVLISHAVN